jgi:methionyl-tRNA synthetase
MKFYLTAAIPYVNAKPHIGHALEFVQGDVIARSHRQRGDETQYITGADENSLKNVQAAEKEGMTTQALCDRNAQAFVELGRLYNISFDNFQRSSSPDHFTSSQELWRLCEAAGDIYKKKYKGLYCVGCEAFYTVDELNQQGECFEHPGRKLDEVEEENYFFKLSRYQEALQKLIESDEYLITPAYKKNEALGFIKQGLQDFSISRSKERARGWGVPVPGDPEQIMYVWFDAMNVYRSGAPTWWPAKLHIIGKGIIRFHAVYWPAILLSAKIALPKELFVHGYITINGQKMSKSLGNVIDPVELVKKYGTDPVRYYLLREIPSTDDGDFSEEKFRLRYNADLANGLGNFASRVLTLAEKLGPWSLPMAGGQDLKTSLSKDTDHALREVRAEVTKAVDERRLHDALANIWRLVSYGDKMVNAEKPWEMKDEDPKKREVLTQLLILLVELRTLILPFMPEVSARITECITEENGIVVAVRKPAAALFPRIA